jgi:hypothetical protein
MPHQHSPSRMRSVATCPSSRCRSGFLWALSPTRGSPQRALSERCHGGGDDRLGDRGHALDGRGSPRDQATPADRLNERNESEPRKRGWDESALTVGAPWNPERRHSRAAGACVAKFLRRVPYTHHPRPAAESSKRLCESTSRTRLPGITVHFWGVDPREVVSEKPRKIGLFPSIMLPTVCPSPKLGLVPGHTSGMLGQQPRVARRRLRR